MDQPVILVVEDEPAIRNVLRASFEDGGFAVVLAATAEEATSTIDANPRAVRALIPDIRLGTVKTGWDVARHGRELNPELPIVYLTASDSDDWAALGVPNSILVKKPFAPAQVLTAVSQLLNVGSAPGG